MSGKKIRVAIIISPDIQDKYLAGHIIDAFEVVGVFIEPQYKTNGVPGEIEQLKKLLKECGANPVTLIKRILDKLYYIRYKKEVAKLFQEAFCKNGSSIDTYKGCPVYYTEYRDISSPENVALLKKLKPDVIVACGCSILKDNLLDVPTHGTINLHSGIAPYYRGCSCYFWPLYNEEPEYVGVTVHYVNPGIDKGEIIHQGRPDIQEDDDENTIFVKMMKVGTKLMIKTLHEIEDGTVKSHKQTEEGKLYLDNMTTVRHFRELHGKLKRGLLREYLAKQRKNNLKPKMIE